MGLVKGIHHVSMKTSNEEDYKKTIDFYKNVLGLKVAREWSTGIMLETGVGIIEIFNNAEDKLSLGTIRHLLNRCFYLLRFVSRCDGKILLITLILC